MKERSQIIFSTLFLSKWKIIVLSLTSKTTTPRRGRCERVVRRRKRGWTSQTQNLNFDYECNYLIKNAYVLNYQIWEEGLVIKMLTDRLIVASKPAFFFWNFFFQF